MEYSTAVTKNNTQTEMNLTDIILSERKSDAKDKIY